MVSLLRYYQVIIHYEILCVLTPDAHFTRYLPKQRGSSLEYVTLNVPEVAIKGNAIPLRTLTDPEGSRRLRLQDFKTNGT
jgi:hypothetical protein